MIIKGRLSDRLQASQRIADVDSRIPIHRWVGISYNPWKFVDFPTVHGSESHIQRYSIIQRHEEI
jgi:hypothetical protein